MHSGTAALYGAVKALGIKSRDQKYIIQYNFQRNDVYFVSKLFENNVFDFVVRVLCPSFTCAACADAVVHAGGTPVAVDCTKSTPTQIKMYFKHFCLGVWELFLIQLKFCFVWIEVSLKLLVCPMKPANMLSTPLKVSFKKVAIDAI